MQLARMAPAALALLFAAFNLPAQQSESAALIVTTGGVESQIVDRVSSAVATRHQRLYVANRSGRLRMTVDTPHARDRTALLRAANCD